MDLYVSDLDGTLLNSQGEVSKRSTKILNHLIEKGLQFTIATARSYYTAREKLKPLNLNLPVILHNGVFVYDAGSNTYLTSNFTAQDTFRKIMDAYDSAGISPFIYTRDSEGSDHVRYTEVSNAAAEAFIKMNKSDTRFKQNNDQSICSTENIISVNAVGNEDKILQCYTQLRSLNICEVSYIKDSYTENFWIYAICPNASKSQGVKHLKEKIGAEKLICFGDHLNDICMFEEANECYAVSNAHENVRNIASSVIGSNDEDSVALHIKEMFEGSAKNN